jgi:hypothetical protein
MVKADLDMDGKPDHVKIKTPNDFLSGLAFKPVPVDIDIDFSATGDHFHETFQISDEVELMYLNVYSWGASLDDKPGYLIFDYSPRASRDAAFFSYKIFKWDLEKKKLCLFVEGDGVPPNQLENEKYSSEKNVVLYSGCAGLGDTAKDTNISVKDDLVSVKVITDRATLFNSPEESHKSKSYLVKGDTVMIVKYQYFRGKDWYLIKYPRSDGKSPIVKWIEGRSIGLELPN